MGRFSFRSPRHKKSIERSHLSQLRPVTKFLTLFELWIHPPAARVYPMWRQSKCQLPLQKRVLSSKLHPVLNVLAHALAPFCREVQDAATLGSSDGFSPSRKQTQKKPPCGGFRCRQGAICSCADVEKFYLASSYFRRGLPPNYRRRCCVSRPSSRWIGVGPQRHGHQDRSFPRRTLRTA